MYKCSVTNSNLFSGIQDILFLYIDKIVTVNEKETFCDQITVQNVKRLIAGSIAEETWDWTDLHDSSAVDVKVGTIVINQLVLLKAIATCSVDV